MRYKTWIATLQIHDPSQQKIEKPPINSVNILFCVLKSLSRDNVINIKTSIDQYGLFALMSPYICRIYQARRIDQERSRYTRVHAWTETAKQINKKKLKTEARMRSVVFSHDISTDQNFGLNI